MMTETNIQHAITGAIWLLGAGLLCALWYTHPANETLDTLLGFVLYVVTFFYVAALYPIQRFVEHRLYPRVMQ